MVPCDSCCKWVRVSVRASVCCWVGRAAWAGEAVLATDAPGYLDLGTDHLQSIPGGLRWWRCTWPQCQKGVLPPGGHPSHSSLILLCLGTLSTMEAATPPDHLCPSQSAGSTEGGDRLWLSPDTHGYPCNAFYIYSGRSERGRVDPEFLTHVVWRQR